MNGAEWFRLAALALVIIWVIQIAWAARKPVDWKPPRTAEYGVPLTRNLYIMSGVLGILVGLAMFIGSFLVWP